MSEDEKFLRKLNAEIVAKGIELQALIKLRNDILKENAKPETKSAKKKTKK